MTKTQNLYSSINSSKTIIKFFLILAAILIGFLMFIQLAPTIAHAQISNASTNQALPTPRTPANPYTTTVTNTAGNGGKPINVCGVISTCPNWIESFKTTSSNPETLAKSVVKFVLIFVYFAIYVSGAIATLFIVGAGYRYITSQGDEKNTKPALETLKNAVIGFILAVLSITIVTFLGNFLTSFNF